MSFAKRALRSALSGLRRHFVSIRNARLRIRAARHKSRLASIAGDFSAYPKVGFVFQFHNKSGNLEAVLAPFVKALKAKNVILFADGCVDSTLPAASRLLLGPQQLVINRNYTHEISNYRMAANILSGWGCEYAVYLQDDDVYARPISLWLDSVLKMMEADASLSIVGLNGGVNVTTNSFRKADKRFTSARFESVSIPNGSGGFDVINRLGEFSETGSVTIPATADASSHVYCATVNRAPQVMRVSDILDLGYFPREMEPYQYDDYFNCFTAWLNGKKCLLAPLSSKRGDVGVGGMRLFNDVTINRRPAHFVRNHNFIVERFGDSIRAGIIQDRVNQANASPGRGDV